MKVKISKKIHTKIIRDLFEDLEKEKEIARKKEDRDYLNYLNSFRSGIIYHIDLLFDFDGVYVKEILENGEKS